MDNTVISFDTEDSFAGMLPVSNAIYQEVEVVTTRHRAPATSPETVVEAGDAVIERFRTLMHRVFGHTVDPAPTPVWGDLMTMDYTRLTQLARAYMASVVPHGPQLDDPAFWPALPAERMLRGVAVVAVHALRTPRVPVRDATENAANRRQQFAHGVLDAAALQPVHALVVAWYTHPKIRYVDERGHRRAFALHEAVNNQLRRADDRPEELVSATCTQLGDALGRLAAASRQVAGEGFGDLVAPLFRGLPLRTEFYTPREAYAVGRQKTFAAFTSFSSRAHVARDFARGGAVHASPVLLTIRTVHANVPLAPVWVLSVAPGEAEWVAPPGTDYRVVDFRDVRHRDEGIAYSVNVELIGPNDIPAVADAEIHVHTEWTTDFPREGHRRHPTNGHWFDFGDYDRRAGDDDDDDDPRDYNPRDLIDAQSVVLTNFLMYA
eukprot:CAMPEP_0174839028 /NCGR_PEP_ID=MMETSP1114-20130205/7782_1 /TAXON_ID=312471 /ORGANISM="Neobodo designis, Strain CCAP 1951/1" /LENGTH=435 /DNA_ID=CAMNT_0016073147 /DNA_START=47 /DNA_END=1352 /DNA_ORIENTATION=-